MSTASTAAAFIDRLLSQASDEEREKTLRYFKTGEGDYAEHDTFAGVRMGTVFNLAKEHIDMSPGEIEQLLLHDVHEVRAGALSIMAKQAARKRTPEERRRELYELYLRRLDRINNWDLVDLAAHQVVGSYLADKPREPLYGLARSENPWARRTAMYATIHFIRHGDLDDTFALAEILLHDRHDLVQKAVGTCLRTAGGHDLARFRAFLDRHAAEAPRTLLRVAIEKLDRDERDHYRGLKTPPRA